MDRKSILKEVSENVREHFWSYLGAVLILSLVSVICNGGLGILIQCQGALRAIRGGLFSIEQLSKVDSEFWTAVGTAPGLGIVGAIAVYFLVNPLRVRVNDFFVKGFCDKPDYKFLSLKDNYKNNVSVMFFSELFFEIIVIAITCIYTVVLGSVGGALLASESVIAIVAGVSFSIAGMIFMAVVLMSVKYNFSLVPYIITEKKTWNFRLIYMFSRKLVYKRKWKIFKLEFGYNLGQAIAVFIPILLFLGGVMMETYGYDGRGVAILGLILIVPMYCLYILFSVYKNVLWAKIYSEFRKELPVEEVPVSEYHPPENESHVSYE